VIKVTAAQLKYFSLAPLWLDSEINPESFGSFFMLLVLTRLDFILFFLTKKQLLHVMM